MSLSGSDCKLGQFDLIMREVNLGQAGQVLKYLDLFNRRLDQINLFMIQT